MRFALRCIIYLGAVYVAILRHDGYLVDPRRLAEAALAVPQQVGQRVTTEAAPLIATRIEAYCRHHPATCLADAMAVARPLADGDAARAGRHRQGVSDVSAP